MWKDYWLKTLYKEDYDNIILELSNNENIAVDAIGYIWIESNLLDEETGEPLRTLMDGYHINLRVCEPEIVPEIVKPFIIPKPNHPVRVWA